jgi:hypothetical protein
MALPMCATASRHRERWASGPNCTRLPVLVHMAMGLARDPLWWARPTCGRAGPSLAARTPVRASPS